MAELIESPRRADLADEVYANREQTTDQMIDRFNDVGLRDLSQRVIELSEMIRVLQDPQNDGEREYRDELRTYLSRDASFGSVNDALDRFEEERLGMLESLADRVNAENASDIGTPDSEIVDRLSEVITLVNRNPDVEFAISQSFISLEETLLSERDEVAAVSMPHELGPTELFIGPRYQIPTDVHFIHIAGNRAASVPDVSVGRAEARLTRARTTEAAADLAEELAWARAFVYNNGGNLNNPTLTDNVEAREWATNLARYLEENVAEDIQNLSGFSEAIRTLNAGNLEQGLRELSEMHDSLEAIVDYAQQITLYEVNPHAVRLFMGSAVVEVQLNEQAIRDIIEQGDEVARRAVFERLYFVARAAVDSLVLRQIPATGSGTNELRIDPDRESTVEEITSYSVSGTVGATWIFGPRMRLDISAEVGYTTVNALGETTISLPDGREMVEPNAVPDQMYIGAVRIDFQNLLRPGEEGGRVTRLRNVVRGFGVVFPNTLTVSEGQAYGSSDFQAYVILVYPEIRRGRTLFQIRTFLGAGTGGHVARDGETIFSPGFRGQAEIEPRLTYSFDNWALTVGLRAYADLTAGGEGRFGQSTDMFYLTIGPSFGLNFPDRGVELTGSVGYQYRGGGFRDLQPHSATGNLMLRMVPQRWSRDEEETGDSRGAESPITSGDIPVNLAEAYVLAVNAGRDQREAALENLRSAVDDLPRNHRLQDDVNFREAVFELGEGDLGRAIERFQRLGAFRELEMEAEE
jgi:hypothetical protein